MMSNRLFEFFLSDKNALHFLFISFTQDELLIFSLAILPHVSQPIKIDLTCNELRAGFFARMRSVSQGRKAAILWLFPSERKEDQHKLFEDIE